MRVKVARLSLLAAKAAIPRESRIPRCGRDWLIIGGIMTLSGDEGREGSARPGWHCDWRKSSRGVRGGADFSVAASASQAETGLPSTAAAALMISSTSGGTAVQGAGLCGDALLPW